MVFKRKTTCNKIDYILTNPEKGRGIFEGKAFHKEDVIEICPVILF